MLDRFRIAFISCIGVLAVSIGCKQPSPPKSSPPTAPRPAVRKINPIPPPITRPDPPSIGKFTADPPSIPRGQLSALHWEVSGTVNRVSVSSPIGVVPTSFTRLVFPQKDTTYTLTASGPGGSSTATVSLMVTTPEKEAQTFKTPDAAAPELALGLEQLKQLAAIHTPDNLVMRLINSRGIAFEPNDARIDLLRRNEVSEVVLAAIKRRASAAKDLNEYEAMFVRTISQSAEAHKSKSSYLLSPYAADYSAIHPEPGQQVLITIFNNGRNAYTVITNDGILNLSRAELLSRFPTIKPSLGKLSVGRGSMIPLLIAGDLDHLRLKSAETAELMRGLRLKLAEQFGLASEECELFAFYASPSRYFIKNGRYDWSKHIIDSIFLAELGRIDGPHQGFVRLKDRGLIRTHEFKEVKLLSRNDLSEIEVYSLERFPILALFDGTVSEIGADELGQWIEVTSADKLVIRYSKLGAIRVQKGQTVLAAPEETDTARFLLGVSSGESSTAGKNGVCLSAKTNGRYVDILDERVTLGHLSLMKIRNNIKSFLSDTGLGSASQ